jgi:hypothetical protein
VSDHKKNDLKLEMQSYCEQEKVLLVIPHLENGIKDFNLMNRRFPHLGNGILRIPSLLSLIFET